MTSVDSSSFNARLEEEASRSLKSITEVNDVVGHIFDRRDVRLNELAQGLVVLGKRLSLLRQQLSKDRVNLEAGGVLGERDVLKLLRSFDDAEAVSDDLRFGLMKMYLCARDSGDDVSIHLANLKVLERSEANKQKAELKAEPEQEEEEDGFNEEKSVEAEEGVVSIDAGGVREKGESKVIVPTKKEPVSLSKESFVERFDRGSGNIKSLCGQYAICRRIINHGFLGDVEKKDLNDFVSSEYETRKKELLSKKG